MLLTTDEKFKRLEIANDLLEYAIMMDEMFHTPKKLIKNIFRDVEKKYFEDEYSEQKFERIKKHHYFATVATTFSYIEDEYISKLNWKNGDANISEVAIERLFVNPSDVDLYRNPMDGNKIKTTEILKHIRDALNHHENGILYKYIEDEDAIEIDLKDVGRTHDGKVKRFHVKVPVNMLKWIIYTLNKNEIKKSRFIHVLGNVDYKSKNLKDELKNKIKIIRIIPIKAQFDETMLNKLYTLKPDEMESQLYNWQQEGRIKIKEYTYNNGAITDFQIDSICEQFQSPTEYDWRTEKMYSCLAFVNALKLKMALPDNAKEIITKYLSTRNTFPLGILSFGRFDASAIFNKVYLRTWNSSYFRILEQKMIGIRDLHDMTNMEWFVLDPVEKVYTDYEAFIRYAIVNFAPIGKNNKPLFVEYDGKKYNCTFLRNAFSHGRIGIVKKGGQYLFALYDTPTGLGNEVKYCKDEHFKPKMYTATELIKFAQYLCKEEKKKVENESSKAILELGQLKKALLNNTNNCAAATVQNKKRS